MVVKQSVSVTEENVCVFFIVMVLYSYGPNVYPFFTILYFYDGTG